MITALLTSEVGVVNALALHNLSSLCSWLIFLLLLPIATAALSHFLQMTFEKGMIFRKYFALITYWLWFKPRPIKYHFDSAYDENVIWSWREKETKYLGSGQHIAYFKRSWYSWFYKPLGGCIFCNGTWIAIAFYWALSYYLFQPTPLKITGLFLFIGANYIWTKILSKVVE